MAWNIVVEVVPRRGWAAAAEQPSLRVPKADAPASPTVLTDCDTLTELSANRHQSKNTWYVILNKGGKLSARREDGCVSVRITTLRLSRPLLLSGLHFCLIDFSLTSAAQPGAYMRYTRHTRLSNSISWSGIDACLLLAVGAHRIHRRSSTPSPHCLSGSNPGFVRAESILSAGATNPSNWKDRCLDVATAE